MALILCQHFAEVSEDAARPGVTVSQVQLFLDTSGFLDTWEVQTHRWDRPTQMWLRMQSATAASPEEGLRRYFAHAPAGPGLAPHQLTAWGGASIWTQAPHAGGVPLLLGAEVGGFAVLATRAMPFQVDEARELERIAQQAARQQPDGSPWQRAHQALSFEEPGLMWLAWFCSQYPAGVHALPPLLTELDRTRRKDDRSQPHGNLPFEHFVRTALEQDPPPGFRALSDTQREMLRLSTIMFCQLLVTVND